MGGKALKNYDIRRYSKNEYFSLSSEIIPKLRSIFNTKVELVQSYKNKDSFGDMDILVFNDQKSNPLNDIRNAIDLNFRPNIILKNGNIWSFDYKNLQIDLIITNKENWETSKIFFRFGDLGNLMGKIYHKLGLKYGFSGLIYPLRNDKSQKLGDIIITKDLKIAFEFLGLNFKKFEKGFKTKEEIFNYIISSKYFDFNIYEFKNLNSINRKRNKRRKMYNEFLNYIKDKNIKKSYPFYKDKKLYIDLIDSYFSGCDLRKKIRKLEINNLKIKKRSNKFNGNIIMNKIPNLKGKNLGKAIKNYRDSFKNFETYLDNNNSKDIINNFMGFYNEWKEKNNK